MTVRKPRAGSARGYEPDEFSSVKISIPDTGDAVRMGSGLANPGRGFDHPPAGWSGGADYIRDRSKTVEEQNAAKNAGQVEPPPRRSDYTGPQPLGDDAYNADWRSGRGGEW